jgi:UDP-N-acetylmuramate dehydrogenase
MYSDILKIIPEDRVKANEEMKWHTSFQIGGPVDLMLFPGNCGELRELIKYCRGKSTAFFVFGLGSNLLVRDKGFRGIAIKTNGLNSYSIVGENIIAEAGVSLSELARIAADNSLSGLEFAEGIPGSLGGAVVMNAGAYDGEMKSVLLEVAAIDAKGNEKIFKSHEMKMGYRSSIFQEEDYIVASATIELQRGIMKEIKAKMEDFAIRRREKQPLDLPSAGSTFRRPEGFYVGPMLEKMGLKGFRIGGAEVSRKHAGFIVNAGNATASDVLKLIEYIRAKAQEQYGVNLQPEVRILGEE